MSPEIRIKRPRRLVPKIVVELLATIVAAGLILFGYFQLPAVPKNRYEVEFVRLEATGQLLKADDNLDTEQFEKVTVTEIVDGDTVKVTRRDGTTETIRYIGIDTPEIKHQGNGIDEPFGPEATAVNRWLVDQKAVYLQKDAAETDRYGRLLRYVYTENGIMVNYVLVRLGYATIMTIPPNIAFQQQLYEAQELARGDEKNLFAPK